MARLPTPGGDDGSWGTLLNDYLLVAHNPDGTLQAGSVQESQLSSAVQTKLNSGGGGGAVSSVAGRAGDVTLTKSDVGLGSVDNTADASKTFAGTQITSGTVAPAQLGSGTPSSSNYLRGDGAWTTIVSPASIGTEVLFSTLSGADDDTKLASFMTVQAAGTFKGKTLVLDEVRDYTFTQPQTLYNGFSLRGPFRPQDQPRSSRPIGNRVLLRMASAGGWFNLPTGNTFGVSISNLSIDGDTNSRLIDGRSDGVLWTSNFSDISVQNALGVFGSPSQALLVTASSIDGWWNVNNVQDRAFNIGGSDFFIQPTMMLLDSPLEMLPATKYLMSYEFASNSWLRNIYCTAEGHTAFLLSGSNTTSTSNWVKDCVWEGRNTTHPSPGSLLRIDGGQYVIRDCRFGYAMTDPTSTGRDDAGVVHIKKGNVTMDGCTYNRASGVSEDVPFVYIASGSLRIRNIVATDFTTGQKPVVYAAVSGLVDADNSVEVFVPVPPSALTGAGNTSTAFSNAATSITVNKPASIADGDLLVAAIVARANTAAYSSPPSGWTEVVPPTDNTSPGVVRFYYKAVPTASSEPTNYTWSGGTSGRVNAIIFRVTNANLAAPLGQKSDMTLLIGGPDRVIIPSVTTTAPTSLQLMVGATNTSGGIGASYYSNGSVTVVESVTTSTGSSETSTTIAQRTVPVGASGTVSWVASASTSSGSGYTITINGIY